MLEFSLVDLEFLYHCKWTRRKKKKKKKENEVGYTVAAQLKTNKQSGI